MEHLKSSETGLTGQEASRRLEQYGPNKLAEGKKVTLLQRFLKQLSDPMIIILLVAAAVSGVTAAYSGESFADVFIILIVVLINAVLGVYQESKAEKAIEALQEMTAATSKVLRDGKMVMLRSDELVPGDIVILEAGDAVPADCRIIESASLKAEEAASPVRACRWRRRSPPSPARARFPWATATVCSTWAPPWSTAAAGPWCARPA